MLGYLLGRPTNAWKRREVFTVLLLSLWYIIYGSRRAPRIPWLRRVNRAFRRFAPYRIIISTLTAVYALHHLDNILGFAAPDASAQIYSRAYQRAVWIVTGLDVGFATAMSIRPKWLRDICSILFSGYYLIHAETAEAKISKWREACTIDMLRATWDKTTNPYVHAVTTFLSPSVGVRYKVQIPRPQGSKYTRPVTAWFFFAPPADELCTATELILDFPGGGYVAMGPLHHEERLRRWAIRTGKPVLSVDYGKAPEFPYPYAIDEAFDVYRTLTESAGLHLGMSGKRLSIIMTGDSAGGNIATNVVLKILESATPVPRPAGLALTYASLNFAFASWSWPRNSHGSTSECDRDSASSISASSVIDTSCSYCPPLLKPHVGPYHRGCQGTNSCTAVQEEDKAISAGVVYHHTNASLFEKQQEEMAVPSTAEGFCEDGTSQSDSTLRVTMSSRAGYLHDRIITPSMMWAMAVLYLGREWKQGLESDYHVSPILAPDTLLAEFPPLLMQCGGRDPLVDDTMHFASCVAEAKRRWKGTGSRSSGVTVQILPEWSHGYLQMSAILPEARGAINDIADWMDEQFRIRPKA